MVYDLPVPSKKIETNNKIKYNTGKSSTCIS